MKELRIYTWTQTNWTKYYLQLLDFEENINWDCFHTQSPPTEGNYPRFTGPRDQRDRAKHGTDAWWIQHNLGKFLAVAIDWKKSHSISPLEKCRNGMKTSETNVPHLWTRRSSGKVVYFVQEAAGQVGPELPSQKPIEMETARTQPYQGPKSWRCPVS